MKSLKIGIMLLALLLAAMAMVPMVSAVEDSGQAINPDFVATSTHQIDSAVQSMTKDEFDTYVSEMVEKYGSDTTKGLKALDAMDVVIPYPDTYHAEFQNAWTENLTSGPGGISGSSSCALVLYKATATDPQGKDHYFYYLWTSAKPKGSYYLYDFWNKLDLTNGNSRIISYSPGSTIFANGQPVTVSSSITYGGVSYSISKQYTLNQDRIEPTDDTVNGYGGLFGVEWIGHYNHAQEIAGVMHVDVPAGQSLTGTWTNYLYSYI